MDVDCQSEPMLELESLITRKTSFDKHKPKLISSIHKIYSIVVSSPESKPKWLKKPKNLICLSPQLQLQFEKGKYSLVGKVEWNSNSNDQCWFKEKRQGIYFFCENCNGKYHEEIKKAPVVIKNHHLDPKHYLELATAGFLSRSRECYCCDDDLLWIFYYCSACDFAINVSCVEKPPLLLSIDHPKWHEHTLAPFARHAPLTCSLCALSDTNSPVYMCPPCGFVVHLKCVNKLPRVIKISRHPHRISFTHSFEQGHNWSCSVCRRKISHDYGGYSCIKDGCSYAAHSKCATQSNVWDGKELEGEPEEVEDDDDVEPFVRISDGIIQHFSHQHHHLRLVDENNGGGGYDDDKLCQACITPIYFGNFYSCMHCHFILHDACANLSRKIYHPIHPHRLNLMTETDGDTPQSNHSCSVCSKFYTGFAYKCCSEGCRFKLHVQCGTLSEPLVHESHMHPLFLTSKPGEHKVCSVCKEKSYTDTFNCIECDFALCFRCATLPQKVRYKYDKHMTRPFCRCCKKRCEDRVYFHLLGSIRCSILCSI